MNLEESISLAIKDLGIELYDTVITKENNTNIFRVIIVSKDGITLDKCEEVSKLISPLLDINEPINAEYNLEVSSVGIERKLKKTRHFILSVGDKVRIKDKNNVVYKGELSFANEEKIIVLSEGKEEEFDYDNILSASTYYEW